MENINVGDTVRLNKSAWDILPKLNEDEIIASLGKLKVIEAFPVNVNGFPDMKDLTLRGLDKYMIPSSCVSKVE